MGKRIGFVSTRFSGTDGVSLEANKWAEVFEAAGHPCFWFAGELDRGGDRCTEVPEAHFKDERNGWINDRIFGKTARSTAVTQAIHDRRALLKDALYSFVQDGGIDLLVVENALTLPMHVPLGLALTEVVAETGMPAICHHHDFYWERIRYATTAVGDYLRMAFPPLLPNIQHVVINSEAREQLALRTGIASVIIPNVLDFDHPPAVPKRGTRRLRERIGLGPKDRMVLQPTRIVQRKGIEHAVDLVKALDDPRAKLVISHEAGDEGMGYADWLAGYACENGVDLRLISSGVHGPWGQRAGGGGTLSLWDVYPLADFITFPSLYEGFGNAFLEAVYFGKPLLINRYGIFVRDIEPLGFDLAVMDGYLSRATVETVREVLGSPVRRERMVETNYRTAARHFSYDVLRRRLNGLLSHFFGADIEPLRGIDRTEDVPAGFIDIQPQLVRYRRFDSRDCSAPVSMTGS